VRVLVSTFGGDDVDKVINAMRTLSYERLVLIGESSIDGSEGLREIELLEQLAGREVEVDHVDKQGFLEQVDAVSEVLMKYTHDTASGSRNTVALNISGGSKILGDAALLAAFRIGIEAYHCDERVTKLPVLKGANVVDMFTPLQTEFITCVGDRDLTLDEVVSRLGNKSRQSAERILRELRRAGILRTEIRAGRIRVSLSESGSELGRMIRITRGERAATRR